VNLAFIVFLKGRFARRRKKGKDSFMLLFTGAALSDMTLMGLGWGNIVTPDTSIRDNRRFGG